MLYQTGTILIIGLLSGAAAIAATYALMRMTAKNKPLNESDSEILDIDNLNLD